MIITYSSQRYPRVCEWTSLASNQLKKTFLDSQEKGLIFIWDKILPAPKDEACEVERRLCKKWIAASNTSERHLFMLGSEHINQPYIWYLPECCIIGLFMPCSFLSLELRLTVEFNVVFPFPVFFHRQQKSNIRQYKIQNWDYFQVSFLKVKRVGVYNVCVRQTLPAAVPRKHYRGVIREMIATTKNKKSHRFPHSWA